MKKIITIIGIICLTILGNSCKSAPSPAPQWANDMVSNMAAGMNDNIIQSNQANRANQLRIKQNNNK